MTGRSIRSSVVCLLVSISAMPALDGPASAYVVSTTSSGQEIKWQVPSASYLFNTEHSPAGSLEAIRAGMQTWTDVPTASFVFIYAGTTTSSAHGKNDGQNIVTFARMGANGTLAENAFWYSTGTGEILDSDIRFNTHYSWSASGAPGEYDVQNVATHELGHSLSLDDLYDAADSEKTMYGYASLGEIKKRTLDPDDVAGISHLYPDGGTIGDFDGDRKTDIAVWRPSNGTWYVKPSSEIPAVVAQWGDQAAGDVPAPGDFDGDGKTDFAVWRPSSGTWYVKPSSGIAAIVARWGDQAAGDIPVPGDFDGDGKTDMAVWRPSDGSWYVNPSSGVAAMVTPWGDQSLGDIPVPGDFDGDGKTDFAVWRPSDGSWYVKPFSGIAAMATQWGDQAAGDKPVLGDFDGDGKTDFAVWRPSNGTWYVKPSSGIAPLVVQWGDQVSGDQPVNRPMHLWGSP